MTKEKAKELLNEYVSKHGTPKQDEVIAYTLDLSEQTEYYKLIKHTYKEVYEASNANKS